eukprot:COSAG02_NODE_53885_length_299_cov_0.770000_1_plen_62_part_10
MPRVCSLVTGASASPLNAFITYDRRASRRRVAAVSKYPSGGEVAGSKVDRQTLSCGSFPADP